MHHETAKVFWTGRSQAVRLPKAFRLPGTEVRVRRQGAAVVLEPLPENWDWLDNLTGPLDADFVAAAQEQPAAQERPGMDKMWS